VKQSRARSEHSLQFAVDNGSGRFCQQVEGNSAPPAGSKHQFGGRERRPLNICVLYAFLAGRKV
jgi:hypothetical protein